MKNKLILVTLFVFSSVFCADEYSYRLHCEAYGYERPTFLGCIKDGVYGVSGLVKDGACAFPGVVKSGYSMISNYFKKSKAQEYFPGPKSFSEGLDIYINEPYEPEITNPEGEKINRSKSPGIINTVTQIGNLAEHMRMETLPAVEETAKDLNKTLADALKEIRSLREQTLVAINKTGKDALKESEKHRELIQSFIHSFNRIPSFLKSFLIMAVGSATSYASIKHIMIPGINKLTQVYAKTNADTHLKNLAWLQTFAGIGLAATGFSMLNNSWDEFKEGR